MMKMKKNIKRNTRRKTGMKRKEIKRRDEVIHQRKRKIKMMKEKKIRKKRRKRKNNYSTHISLLYFPNKNIHNTISS